MNYLVLTGVTTGEHYKMCLVSCLSFVDCNPVCCGKPFMALDVIDPVLQVAETFGEIHLQQVSQQILQVGAKVRGKSYLERKIKDAKMICTSNPNIY